MRPTNIQRNTIFLFLAGNATEYSKHLFRALDKNKDNRVSFKEVMLGFHHLSSHGSQEERLKIVFTVSSNPQWRVPLYLEQLLNLYFDISDVRCQLHQNPKSR